MLPPRDRSARISLRAPARASLALFALALADAAAELPPHELKVAFLGDQGNGANAVAVLELVAAEGAHAVVHQGDFDYAHDPAGWDALISSVLGPDHPYFASIGNHDQARFYGPSGYQSRLRDRMLRLGIPWSGDLGVQSAFTWMGLHFVIVAPGIFGPGDGLYDLHLRDRFAASDAVWRIASWHKNQHLMQAGGKSDETGWGVYEESRRAGAIIATAHEHSYSRTHLLSSMQQQLVASTEEPLVLTPDDPASPGDEGRSFAFVSGLGGKSIRDQGVFGDWFASVYTSTQGATYGALFGVFHVDGDPRLARFYFKDIAGRVIDEFVLRSRVGCGDLDDDGICDERDVCSDAPDPSQLDSDFDGYGNACDADYDGDGAVDADDLLLLTGALPSSAGDPAYAPALDADGDGAIGDLELALLELQSGGPPGPSGLGCAGGAPCSACDAADTDGDGLCDAVDDCVAEPNPGQVDSDLDGYGNACDADYTNDGVVGGLDLFLFGMGFGASAGDPAFVAAADADADGMVGGPDLLVLGRNFLGAPGPSGRDCAGTFPCLGP
jgi:hypothetical protein